MTPGAAPLVRFEGVTKRFGDTAAVDRVSLDILEGEFFALLGPSGCGKTTLMRLLAGFEAPDEGRILLGGEDLAAVPPHRRPINMMFQSYALFPHLSVEKNVAFGLRMAGMGKAAIAERVGEMLQLVRLEGFGARLPDQLSGGQKQRVALARAIARRPRILLLDEPLAALDKKLREETQFELTSLQTRLGITFLTVTHDQNEAMVLADRIGVMNLGRIAQVGSPAEVYEAPIDRFVAEFVGDINMFEVIVEASDKTAIRLAGPEGSLRMAPRAGPAAGAPAWLAVRPEKLRLSATSPAKSAANVLSGEIRGLAYVGDLTTYRVELGSGRLIRVTHANASRAATTFTAGDKVFVSFEADAGVLLPR